MKKQSCFIVFFLGLFLAACGSGDGGGGGGATKTKNTIDPWKGIGALLPESGLEGVRKLGFTDGMGISYDERDTTNGAEEVCRQENRDGDIYEVCMPLEDDPYFIPLENHALVWHPLMFDRFATELTCYTYMEDDEETKIEEDCWAGIFPFMVEDDEDFYCEAGLLNGDKALKCSDGWAVVVNGDNDETKSICRVHMETGSGRCLGSPKHGFEDVDLILTMQRTSWQGYQSMQDNPKQFAPGDTGLPLLPEELPAGAQIIYTSHNPDICSVDNDDSDGGKGTVMIDQNVTPPDMCKISIAIEAEGYVDRILFAELPILKESDVEWPHYIRSNNYFYPGETLNAEEMMSSDPAPSLVEAEFISLDKDVCTVDEASGELMAVAPGACVVRMTAKVEDYLDVVVEYVIPVDTPTAVFVDITWDAFEDLDIDDVNNPAVVGAVIPALALPVAKVADGDDADEELDDYAGAADFEYEVVGDCALDNNRVISFTDSTECVVTVTAYPDERDEASFSKEFKFTPGMGSFTLVWGGYGSNNAVYGSDPPVLDAPETVPANMAGGEYSYSASGGGCQVNEFSGALTILGADNGNERKCEVSLVVSRSGYENQKATVLVRIDKRPQDALTVTNPYGTSGAIVNLMEAQSIDIVNPPMGGVGEVEYQIPNAALSGCEIDGSSGTVTVKTGTTTGTCLVQARWSGDEENAASAWVDITTVHVRSSGQVKPVWGTEPYGDAISAVVQVGETLVIGTAPSGSGGNPEYRSASEERCIVDAASGLVTGVATGECLVQFRFVGNATSAASPWSDSVTIGVSPGDHPTDIGAQHYGATATVADEGTLELVNPPTGFGKATYSVKTGSETYCEVDENTGTVTGILAGNCTIQVMFAGDDNYEALEASDLSPVISVTQLDQKISSENPYGENPTMGVGGSLIIINEPTATILNNDGENVAGGEITYEVSSPSVCQVDNRDGTVEAQTPGECIVQIQVAAVDAVAADEQGGVVGNAAYNSTVRDIAIITVDTGRFSFKWNPYESYEEYRAGGEGRIARVNVGYTGAMVKYSVVNDGETGCAFKGTSGVDAITLTFDAYGVCLLKAVATKTHYEDWSVERYIRVRPGTISVTAGQFGGSDTLKVGVTTAKKPAAYNGLNPTDAKVVWRLVRGEKDCRLLNEKDGSVVAQAVPIEDPDDPPQCSLQLVAKKKNYDTFRSAVREIPLERGELGTVSAPVYGSGFSNTLPLTILRDDSDVETGREGHVDMTRVPREDNGLPITISSFEVLGYENNETTVKQDVCTVDNDNMSKTFGRVMVGNAAGDGDKCKIMATAKAVGYDPKLAPVLWLTVVEGEFNFGTELNPVPVFAFIGELKVGSTSYPSTKPGETIQASDTTYDGMSYLDFNMLPENYNMGDSVNGVAISWDYQAHTVDSNGTEMAGGCEIVEDQNDNDRRSLVVAPTIQVGGSCLVTAVAQVEGYAEYSVAVSIPLCCR